MEKTQIAKHFILKKTPDKQLEVPSISITQYTTHDIHSYATTDSKNIYVLSAECYARIAMSEYEYIQCKDPKSAEAYILDDLKRQILEHVYGDILKELELIAKECQAGTKAEHIRESLYNLISAINKI